MHGSMTAEAVVSIVKTGLQLLMLFCGETPIQQGCCGGGENVVECVVDRATGWSVGVCYLSDLDTCKTANSTKKE